MKKLFYYMFALAALAMTNTSCQDEMENGSNANEVAVTFDLQLENAVGSRLAGDGTKATKLQYWVYKAETDTIGDELENLRGTATFENLNATVTLTLVKGQTYNFLFWAQSADGDSYYTVDEQTGVVTVDYATKDAANNENRDAFFKVRKNLKITGPVTETIVLKRPFAQINVGTTIGSLAGAATAEVNIAKSNFTVDNAATSLNTYSGSATEGKAVNYSLANIIESNKADKEGDLKNVEGENYEHLAMNYILVTDYTDNNTTDNYGVGENKQLVNTTFEIFDDQNASVNKFEVPNVPVRRNWRTNIIGDILNESVTFNVVIDPKFDNDHNYITHEELAYAAKNGGVVTLTEDVTLQESLTVTANMVVNLNGHDITVTSNDEEVGKGDAFIVTQGKLTINGEGTVKAFTRPVWACGNGGAEIIINGGTYIGSQQGGSSEVIYASGNGKVTINGGSFEALSKCLQMPQQDYTVLNLYNNGKDGCAIIVKGGTFKNFDPANNKSENPAQSFVADGYKSVQVDDDYVVVPNEVKAVVANATDLNTALAVNEPNVVLAEDVVATSTIVMAKGGVLDGNGNKLTMESSASQYAIQPAGGTIKNLDIVGYNNRNSASKVIRGVYIVNPTEDVIISDVNVSGVAYSLNTGAKGSAADLKLKVSNSTLVGWSSWDGGFEAAEFKNCVFGVGSYFDATVAGQELWNGFARPYIETTFEGCEFAEGFKIDAVFTTGSAPNVVTHNPVIKFKNCTMNGVAITAANITELFEENEDLNNVTVE